MKRISMMKAIKLCHKYEKMPAIQRQVLQKERLRELVINAKENSPYFSKLYADIPDDFLLSDLPVTNKRDLMEHWNDWVTDRGTCRPVRKSGAGWKIGRQVSFDESV